jgi:hypothetical protein
MSTDSVIHEGPQHVHALLRTARLSASASPSSGFSFATNLHAAGKVLGLRQRASHDDDVLAGTGRENDHA